MGVEAARVAMQIGCLEKASEQSLKWREGQATPGSGDRDVRRIVRPVATGLVSFGACRESSSLGQGDAEQGAEMRLEGHQACGECAFKAAEGHPVLCCTSFRSRSGELRDSLGAAKPHTEVMQPRTEALGMGRLVPSN